MISKDEIEARYILSFTFMERLLEVKGMFSRQGVKFFLSFKDEKVSILLLNKTLFEPSIYESMQKDESFYRFYQEITELLKIIDTLRLEDKIWKA